MPFSPPDISSLEIDEVVRTLRSGWITTGSKTKLLEKNLASYLNTPRVACLNSATAAMELSLRLLGIGPGDEVITSAYTYSASASVIQHVGARIILVDTAKDSYEIDYAQLSSSITESTKAVIPVDIAGAMCDYDRLFEVLESKKHLFRPANDLQASVGRVIVLADAAHSLGATRKGRLSGQVADFTCFSFHAVKNLTTGEGGAVTWRNIPGFDNEEMYMRFMLLSLHGQSKDALAKAKSGSWEYDILFPGYKCNMTDIVAAIGLAQFARYPALLQKRRELIGLYDSGFDGCHLDVLRHFGETFSSSGHLYLVRLLGKDESERNAIIARMADRGIATNVHYKPLPMHTAYKNMGFKMGDYPNSYQQYKNEITLPLHTLLTEEQVQYVVANLRELL